ncbi:MAG TPA: toll/interleukin-1 receptor domain-containing protein [Rhizomicrobium sp.]|jgi:tetratricopeptide (TPR) repeat protein|nr:toll/interleukin-1 receptor domain-containing protein [Rhizomicrobium sp.]
MRYSAFISYNHRDKRIAAWLHRAIETYRIPPRLKGRQTRLGILGARLPPVFRDREELAASSDLSQSIREALAVSGSLIVVCSPDSARSQWVNEEVRNFSALGRRDQIQCLIVRGGLETDQTDPVRDYMPAALFEGGGSEPLAADLRPGRDRPREAVLKLLAGILGVPFDELRRREQARRQRRMALVVAGLGAGLVVTSGLAAVAFLARNEAVRERDIAEQKTITAERTVDFVKSLFEVSDPSESRGATITAREILDRGASQIDRDLREQPTVKAELYTTLGDVYAGLGLYHQGETLVRRGLKLSGVEDGTQARQYAALGDAQSRQARYDDAVKAYQQALVLAREPDSYRPELVSRILVGLGEAQFEQGKFQPAQRNIREALDLDMKTSGASSGDVARDLETLAAAQTGNGDFNGGRASFKRALAIRLKTEGSSHPRVAEDLNSLGAIAYFQNDPSAEDYYRRAYNSYRAVLGDNHPEVATTMNNLALLQLERRDFADAEPLLKHAVEVIETQRNDDFDDLAFEYENLGRVERGLGHLPEAETLFQKALTVARMHKHRNLAPILVDLADMACTAGDAATGLARLDEAAPIMAAIYAGVPWRSAWVRVVRAGCLLTQGRRDEAAQLLWDNVPVLEKRWAKTTIYGVRAEQLLARADRA